MSTIKDIARETGLSIATISKYLNGGNVLEGNREIISKAITKLDYTVNRAARSLKTNRSMMVGILVPSIDSPFFARIIARVDALLMQNGYNTVVSSYQFDEKLEQQKLRFLLDIGVDGLIVVPENLTAQDFNQVREISSRDIPFIMLDRYVDGIDCDRVLVNNMNAAYDAVERLVLNDHRIIGIITGPLHISTAYERLIGYQRALESYSLKNAPEFIQTGAYDAESGYDLFRQLIAMPNPPTGIFLTNYEMMLGAITAMQEPDVMLPKHLEIVGYDNLEVSRILYPPISMVVQPMDEMGDVLAELMLKRLRGDMSAFPTVRRLKAQLLTPR